MTNKAPGTKETKVLVVEDSAIQRRHIATLLEEAGHLVLQAEDGAEGWDMVQANPPDLVVSDINMPNHR